MNGLIRVGESLFPYLLDTFWQGTALMLIVFAIARFLGSRRPAARYWLLVYCLVGVFLLPIISHVARAHRVPLLQFQEHAVVSRLVTTSPPPAPSETEPPLIKKGADALLPPEAALTASSAEPFITETPAMSLGESAGPPEFSATEKATAEAPNGHTFQPGAASAVAAGASPSTETLPAAERITQSASAFRWRGWVSLVWLVGCAGLSLRLLFAAVSLARIRRSSWAPSDPALLELFETARKTSGVRRGVRFRVGKRVGSAVSVGILRPTILLRETLVRELPLEQLHPVLLHELAHVRSWDYAVNILERIAESFLFFHPFVWLINRELRALREENCDNSVLDHYSDQLLYAKVLTEIAGRGRRSSPRLATVCLFNHRALIERRVENILAWTKRGARRLRLRTALILLSMCLGITGSLSLLSLSARAVEEGGDMESASKTTEDKATPPPREREAETLPAATQAEIPDDLPGAEEMLSRYREEALKFFSLWRTWTPEQKQIHRIRTRLNEPISVEERDRLLSELKRLGEEVEKPAKAAEVRQPAEVIIDVTKDGKFAVAQVEKSIEEINEMLEQIAKFYSGTRIIVRGHEEAPYRSVSEVLDACSKANLLHVSFAVAKDEAEILAATIAFLEKMVGEYQDKVRDSGQALQKFKAEHILELPGTELSASGELRKIMDDLAEAQQELSDAETARKEIEKQLQAVEPTVTVETVLERNPLIAQYEAQLDALELELAKLRERFADQHPEVAKKKEEMERVKALLEKAAEKVTARETIQANPLYLSLQEKRRDSEVRIAVAKRKIDQLSERKAECERRVQNAPALEKEMPRLTEEDASNGKLLEDYTTGLQKARIEQEKDTRREGAGHRIEEIPFQVVGIARERVDVLFTGFFKSARGGCTVKVHWGGRAKTAFVPVGGFFHDYEFLPLEKREETCQPPGSTRPVPRTRYFLTIQKKGGQPLTIAEGQTVTEYELVATLQAVSGKWRVLHLGEVASAGEKTFEVYGGYSIVEMGGRERMFKVLQVTDTRVVLKDKEGKEHQLPFSAKPDVAFVYVEGQVNRPGRVSFLDRGKMTLYRAIIMAGGFTRIAKKSKVIPITTDDAGKEKRMEIDVSEILKKPGLDPPVKPGDIIHVPEQWM